MQNTITVPQDQLNRIETRLKHLEQVLSRLVEQVEQRVAKRESSNVFQRLVESDMFQADMKEAVRLLKEEPSQVSDLFASYRKGKIHV